MLSEQYQRQERAKYGKAVAVMALFGVISVGVYSISDEDTIKNLNESLLSQLYDCDQIVLGAQNENSGKSFKTDIQIALDEMFLKDISLIQQITMSKEILSHLGKTTENIGGPSGFGISASLGLAGSLMEQAGGSSSTDTIGEIVGTNIDKVIGEHDEFKIGIDQLATGENLLRSIDDLKEGQEDIKFANLLSDKGVTSKDGWSLIANQYYDILQSFQRIFKNKMWGFQSAETLINEQGEECHKLLRDNPNLIRYLHFNEFREIKYAIDNQDFESKKIGPWTSAELYRSWIAIRYQLYIIQLLDQMWQTQSSGADAELMVPGSEKYLKLTKDLKRDIEVMQKWAQTTNGFKYDSEYCVNEWKDDLTWQSWRVAQCVDRYNLDHTRRDPMCCEMWHCTEARPDKEMFYWNAERDECVEKCIIEGSQNYRRIADDCFIDQPLIKEEWQEVGVTDWGKWLFRVGHKGYYVCGFMPYFKHSKDTKDEVGLTDLELRFCNVGDWWNYKTSKLTQKGPDPPSGNWYVCPEGTYATQIGVRSEGSLLGGDDSSINGYKMSCRSLDWGDLQSAVNDQNSDKFDGLWGEWLDYSEEKENYFIYQQRAKYEKDKPNAIDYFEVLKDATGINKIGYRLAKTVNGDYYKDLTFEGKGKSTFREEQQ